eukprot:GFUD01113230.1.p1 GENE.GFUD01113230.1~~GFUD01113230.1.p1  ORF type:complete len:245 (-),score=15.71 GFUD01113230.1:114-848(-)
MMFFKCILTSLLIGTYKGMPTEECCRTKEVGGVGYVLVSEGEVPEPCLSGCIYQQDGMPGSKYCFARGSLPVTCGDQTCTQTGRYMGNISKTFPSLPFGNFSVCRDTCNAPECNFWTYESYFHPPPPSNGTCTQFSSVSEFEHTNTSLLPFGTKDFVSSNPTCLPGVYDGTVVKKIPVNPSNVTVCSQACSTNLACNFWSYEAFQGIPNGTCTLFSSVSQFQPIVAFVLSAVPVKKTSHKECTR